MAADLDIVKNQTVLAVEELLTAAALPPDALLVVGCSTSEVQGAKIGSSGSEDIAEAILDGLLDACQRYGVRLAVQCCEHLNRALVVEREVLDKYGLEEVSVRPVSKAGGALAAKAMLRFNNPAVVEEIKAHAGLDIGCTLIGMHLKRVAVPVRLINNRIGRALVTAARTRPKLIGGQRAVY